MIEIKPVRTKTDIEIVESLADEIWRQHYTSIIGKAQVDYMLDKFQTYEAISDQIKYGTFYYLLELNSEPVGYISFYPKGEVLFLSKIYVKNDLRGMGIGKKAIEFLVEEAGKMNLTAISLTVNKNNNKTIAAYEKMGFIKQDAVVMDIGGGFVMDDYVMKRSLK